MKATSADSLEITACLHLNHNRIHVCAYPSRFHLKKKDQALLVDLKNPNSSGRSLQIFVITGWVEAFRAAMADNAVQISVLNHWPELS